MGEQKISVEPNVETTQEKKGNLARTIIIISTLSLIALIAAFFITTIFIPFTYKNPLPTKSGTDGIITIRLYKGSYDKERVFLNTSDEFAEIIRLYKASFNTKLSNAFFGGDLDAKWAVDDRTTSTTSLFSNTISLQFVYDAAGEVTANMPVLNPNGSIHKYNGEQKFSSAIIPVSDNNTFESRDIFLARKLSSGNSYLSNCAYSVTANFYELFKYLDNITVI